MTPERLAEIRQLHRAGSDAHDATCVTCELLTALREAHEIMASLPTWFNYHLDDWREAIEGVRLKLKENVVQIVDLLHERDALQQRVEALEAAAEMLWIVLANVSGGDWTKQSQDWQEAAARWRDNYHAVLRGGETG